MFFTQKYKSKYTLYTLDMFSRTQFFVENEILNNK